MFNTFLNVKHFVRADSRNVWGWFPSAVLGKLFWIKTDRFYEFPFVFRSIGTESGGLEF